MYPSPEVKGKLDTLVRRWLDYDLQFHDSFVKELNVVENYLNSVQTPAGLSAYDSTAAAKANDPTQEDSPNRYYVVVNQVLQTNERILGNFAKARQTITLSGRGGKDSQKAAVLERGSKYVEDRNRTFNTVVFPAIDNMLSGGLGGARVRYDAYDGSANGWICEEFVDPADLIVDGGSKHPFYHDTRRRWIRMQFPKDSIEAEFGGINGFDPNVLPPDNEYTKSQETRGLKTDGDYVTVYLLEYCQRESMYFRYGDDGATELSKEEYDRAKEEGDGRVIPDKKWLWYQVYYNPSHGVFWHAKSDIDYWTILLLAGRRSRNKPYPISDFVAYKNLQDLFNVLVTASLDDAREGRKWAIAMDPAQWPTHGERIRNQIEEGFAVVPSTTAHALSHPGLSQGILYLLDFVKRAVDEINALPAVQRGELPAKQISSETVNVLQAAAAISHGRKDIMINEFITSMARTRMKFMLKKWSEEDFIRVTDAAPGMPEYVPINLTLEGRDAYYALLAKIFKIPIPGQGEVPPEMAQAFEQARTVFEETNDVVVEKSDRHGYDGEMFTSEQYAAHITESGLTPTQFVETKGVQTQAVEIFKINHIDPAVDLDVRCSVDFDIDQTKNRKQSLSYEMGKNGWMHPVDVMRALEIEDPDRKFQRAQQENQLRQIAERLASDLQFQQAVEFAGQVLANPEMKKAVMSIVQGGAQPS